MGASLSPSEILQWYLDAGVDEAIGEAPVDRFQAPPPPQKIPADATRPAEIARPPAFLQNACELAAAAETLDDLRAVIEDFDGCALKKTATKTVFTDGNPEARIVLIGEAPGAEEDRRGLPFVGPSGKLLDRMLASIGLDRSMVLISNTVYWRPPGNRPPTPQETAVCLPFVERLMEIVDPDVVVALGGAAAKSVLARSESVGRLRGRWFAYATPKMPRPAQATAIYHPAYLLRTPAQKRNAWADLRAIRRKLDCLPEA
jgi:DNA polymerase